MNTIRMQPPTKPLLFARLDARLNRGRRFGIWPADLLRHAYVVGKTGGGKTTLLERLLVEQLRAGHGLALLDPHGDLAERVLDFVPRHRQQEVIVIEPWETARPVGLNLLEHASIGERALVASGVLAIFHKVFSEYWGPRLEHVFRNALLALLEVPGTTLLGVLRLLVDERYRAGVVERLEDPLVAHFWRREFTAFPAAFRAEVLAPVQNKVSAALTSPVLRLILGQRRSTVDLRAVMDSGGIVVANLAKGRIGEDASRMLGAVLVTTFQLAAYRRADTAPALRRPFTLVIDEFASFVTASFAELLAEARKYGLALVMAHQYLAQLDEALRAAVMGNTGTLIAFRLGADDAERMGGEFYPELTPSDLTRLARHQIALRLSIDGLQSPPFTAETLAPFEEVEREGHADIIRRISAERYGTLLASVERDIVRQLGAASVSQRPQRPHVGASRRQDASPASIVEDASGATMPFPFPTS